MNNLLLIGGAVVALVIAYNINNAAVRSAAVSNERARVDSEARKKNDIAQTARKRVTPDNATSVLDKFYRD